MKKKKIILGMTIVAATLGMVVTSCKKETSKSESNAQLEAEIKAELEATKTKSNFAFSKYNVSDQATSLALVNSYLDVLNFTLNSVNKTRETGKQIPEDIEIFLPEIKNHISKVNKLPEDKKVKLGSIIYALRKAAKDNKTDKEIETIFDQAVADANLSPDLGLSKESIKKFMADFKIKFPQLF